MVRIARRGLESSARLGRHRWKAERSIAWLVGCRRPRIRYGRDGGRFFAFAAGPRRAFPLVAGRRFALPAVFRAAPPGSEPRRPATQATAARRRFRWSPLEGETFFTFTEEPT